MSQYPSVIDLSSLNGTNGFKITGVSSGDYTGNSVASAGDVNGDGLLDLIIGAPGMMYDSARPGAAFVVFGTASGFGANIDLSSLDGSDGFRLSGSKLQDYAGRSVASADVNGDGFADLIIGAPGADQNGPNKGFTYVVFGKAGGFASNLDLSTLDGSNGFRLVGATSNSGVGLSVASAGDFNGDSVDDMIVGSGGSSYVVFGRTPGFPAQINVTSLNGSNGFQIAGAGPAVASAGDINGDGYADVIVGQPTSSPHGTRSGASYVVFGSASGFGSSINVSSLDGSNGFKISGAAANDLSGTSVASAGDINDDGFADLIVGAPGVDPNGGAAYVIFGKAGGFGANIDLSSLDGSNGFKITGADATGHIVDTGWSVASAGDVNGDGFDDIIVGAPGTYDYANSASYVVFGKAGGFGANIDLSSLDGSNGFKLSGAAAGDFSGRSVASAGDVNGDGIADLIIGADGAGPHGSASGASYVVFGKTTGFGANVDLSSLDGSSGFRISGAAASDHSGFSVASAGDVNHDGFDDVIIGATNVSGSGASYVVFGHGGAFASNIDLSSLNGTTGFKLSGAAVGDQSGFSVASAGDINGDGFADLIVGARNAAANGNGSGASYVVFGKASGFASNINLSSLDGTNGFKLSGAAAGDASGYSVASAGDVNGDGFDDLIIGAPHAASTAGASYVVFGTAGGFASNINLSSLDGSNGFKIDHAQSFDTSGHSVASAGDLNGDGFADLIIGAPNSSTNSYSGASYVLYGRAPDTAVDRTGTDASQTLAGGDFNDILHGMGGDDQLYGNGGDDVLDGGTGDDVMRGGAGDDTYYVDSAGDKVIEAANQGTDTVHTTVSYTLAPNVEVLIADSDAGLTLTGNALDNTIIGGAGNDQLDGKAGADHMQGGNGDDTYYVDNSGDVVTEFAHQGTDTVHTTVSYALAPNVEILISDSGSGLTLAGNDLDNTITGGAGNDLLNGRLGADHMDGGAGDDVYIVDNPGDTITDSAGTDLVQTSVNYTIGTGIEYLRADSNAGLILGGNDQDNGIHGGGGNDHLFGGLGRDILTGGSGDDVFEYRSIDDSGTTAATRDTIADFSSGDLIDLSAIDAITGGAHDDFTFVGNAAFTAAGQVRWEARGDNTVVQVNVDGSPGADMSILLQGVHSLTAGDFKLS